MNVNLIYGRTLGLYEHLNWCYVTLMTTVSQIHEYMSVFLPIHNSFRCEVILRTGIQSIIIQKKRLPYRYPTNIINLKEEKTGNSARQ